MSCGMMSARRGWVKRVGWTAALWAGTCGIGLFAGMSPRPLLLAGLCAAVAFAFWLTSDSFLLAEPTDWHVSAELSSPPRGLDGRVAALEREIARSPTSISSRMLLHQLLTDLADERLLSLRGIDRQLDPPGARAALGPELDDYVTNTDPEHTGVTDHRMSLLLNRIESL